MAITINSNYGQVVETNYGTMNNTASGGAAHFHLHGSEAEGRELYVQLVAGGFISGSMDSWLDLMGYVAERPANVQPLEWKKTMQQARVMLCHALKEPLENNAIAMKDMEQMASQCFTKNGNPMCLIKPKKEISADIDKLEQIFFDLKKSIP